MTSHLLFTLLIKICALLVCDFPLMMMTFITQGGEGRGKTNKKRKATKSKGRGLEEGASRALMRQVGEEGCGGRDSHDRDNVSPVPQAALEDPEG